MNNLIRRRVSQNRKRLVEGQYDLDLTYITDNIVAMGYPSDSPIQSIIRNHIVHVSRFLNERHPDAFKIFNLCSKYDYNFSHFRNMVEVIPFDDHTAPKFLQISEFCAKADSWLKEKIKNVIIVHCKAGKGRTGTMISCYLIHSKICKNPFDAMNEFSGKRTKDQKGVTIPSQRRYVEYYGDYLKNNRVYKELKVNVKSIKISQSTNFFFKYLSFEVHNKGSTKIYDSQIVKFNSEKNYFKFVINETLSISGDIKINFLNKTKDCVFSVTFNTFCSFNSKENNEYSLNEESCQGLKQIDDNGNIRWTLKKETIDLAAKNKNFDSSLEIEFVIETTEISNRQEQVKSLYDNNIVDLEEQEKSRISTYDNVSDKKSKESSDKQKMTKFKKIARLFKKNKPSNYRSNSEPFLNTDIFKLSEKLQDMHNSTESLDIELEKNHQK